MDEAAALFRIRVVVVSTRAAVRSLIPGDDEVLTEVVERARGLLNDIESNLEPASADGVHASLAEARDEVEKFARGDAVPKSD